MKSVLMSLLLFVLTAPFVNAQQAQTNILVLHSSSAEVIWVESVNQEFEKIRQENFPDVRFYYEFMNENYVSGAPDTDIWAQYLES